MQVKTAGEILKVSVDIIYMIELAFFWIIPHLSLTGTPSLVLVSF